MVEYEKVSTIIFNGRFPTPVAKCIVCVDCNKYFDDTTVRTKTVSARFMEHVQREHSDCVMKTIDTQWYCELGVNCPVCLKTGWQPTKSQVIQEDGKLTVGKTQRAKAHDLVHWKKGVPTHKILVEMDVNRDRTIGESKEASSERLESANQVNYFLDMNSNYHSVAGPSRPVDGLIMYDDDSQNSFIDFTQVRPRKLKTEEVRNVCLSTFAELDVEQTGGYIVDAGREQLSNSKASCVIRELINGQKELRNNRPKTVVQVCPDSPVQDKVGASVTDEKDEEKEEDIIFVAEVQGDGFSDVGDDEFFDSQDHPEQDTWKPHRYFEGNCENGIEQLPSVSISSAPKSQPCVQATHENYIPKGGWEEVVSKYITEEQFVGLFNWQKDVLKCLDGTMTGLEEADEMFRKYCTEKINARPSNVKYKNRDAADKKGRPGVPRPVPNNQQRKFTQRQKRVYLIRMYKNSKKKAMGIVRNGGLKTDLMIPVEEVEEFYEDILEKKPYIENPLIIRRAAEEPAQEIITIQEVKQSLQKGGNTSPGPDKITFKDLRMFDRQCIVMTVLCNQAMNLRAVPARWKQSITTLIPKNDRGDLKCLANRRPVSCQQTVYKVYSGVINTRLEEWSTRNKLTSDEQAGFQRGVNGCMNNVFAINEVLQSGGYAMFADVAQAFNRLPHEHIKRVLVESNAGYLAEVIMNFYSGAMTAFRANGELTKGMNVRAGVLQGDRCSPILFNLCIQPVINKLQLEQDKGVSFQLSKRNVLAFADDLCVFSATRKDLQELVDTMTGEIEACGLSLNVQKCFTTAKPNQRSVIRMKNQQLKYVDADTAGKYLGSPVPEKDGELFQRILQDVLDDVNAIDRSDLTPWQKIDACNVFALSKVPFFLQTAAHTKGELDKVDRAIRVKMKKWMGMNATANNNLCYVRRKEGGGGIMPLVILDAASKIATALKVLNSADSYISGAAKHGLARVVRKRMSSNATVSDEQALKFLNERKVNTRQNASFWDSVLGSLVRINGGKDVEFKWAITDGLFELEVIKRHSYKIINKSNMNTAYTTIVDELKNEMLTQLEGRATTWAYKTTSRHPCSNYPLQDGSLREAEFYMIQRAKTHSLSTRVTQSRYARVESRMCRWCGDAEETTYHALNICMSKIIKAEHLRRHNRVCTLLAEQARSTNTTQVSVNEDVVPALSRDMKRPDIQIVDKTGKTALFIDVAISVDSFPKMAEAERRKITKYNDLKLAYEDNGYKTRVMGFIVGSCGSWYDRNDRVLTELNVQSRNLNRTRSDIVTATMKGTYEVWKCFATGQKQGYLKRGWNQFGREYDSLFHIDSLMQSRTFPA